jgi:signal transduction histidine kinase
VASHHQVGTDLTAVEAAMADWRAALAEPVIAAVQAADRSGALRLINAAARARFDTVRTRVGDLQATVQSLRDTAVSDVRRSSQEIVWSLVGAVWVVVIAGLVLALLLRRTVTSPVRRLAADVRQIAAGDYNRPVRSLGPPEVTALGADVDEMRRRIVSDLRVVRSARDAVERANTDLERQAAELLRSNQDLEQFAYVASHDLQEPLRKVASFCQLLQRRYAGLLDERADQYISYAVDGAHRMQRLINDLLEFSRIGRAANRVASVDLNQVADAAVANSEYVLSKVDGTVSYRDLPTVLGHEQLLVALFGNLISNSVKFRRPDVTPHVHLSAVRDGDQWRLICRDNGIGIDAAYADKVFVIFQRLHSRDAYPGTGIGLAVSKRIVEYHGGRIWVDTDAAEGTTICLTLPGIPFDASADAELVALEERTEVPPRQPV